MHSFVSLNREILPAENTFLAAVSSAALYGKTVFTTLAVYESVPFLWAKHWNRLKDHAVRLKIDLNGFAEEDVKTQAARLIAQNEFKNGRLRLTVFDEAPSAVWNSRLPAKTSLLLTSAEHRQTKTELKITVSPFPLNSKAPLAGIKTGNYLENLLVLEEAQNRGFDEAIRLNEKGEIASAALANIFWIKAGEIFTPSLSTGCLAGTLRALLLENYKVHEVRQGLPELLEADEIFLTSAGIEIRPAVIEKKSDKPFQISLELREFLDLQKVKS